MPTELIIAVCLIGTLCVALVLTVFAAIVSGVTNRCWEREAIVHKAGTYIENEDEELVFIWNDELKKESNG